MTVGASREEGRTPRGRDIGLDLDLDLDLDRVALRGLGGARDPNTPTALGGVLGRGLDLMSSGTTAGTSFRNMSLG